MIDNKNYLIAIVLSFMVMITWHYTVNAPQMERQKQEQALLEEQQALEAAGQQDAASDGVGIPQPGGETGAPAVPQATPAAPANRETAVAATPRIPIETPEIEGSISLRGGRIDDVVLRQYRETVDPGSDQIVLLSPSGGPSPYYAEFGFVGASGQDVALPNADTIWELESGDRLTPSSPVVLRHEAGDLTFRRTISIDNQFMFTVADTVTNASGDAVSVFPYGLVSRHGLPDMANFYILHEGLIGVLGEDGLQEIDYDDLTDDGPQTFSTTGGWLGITDKYWATALVPEQDSKFKARFASGSVNAAGATTPTFQADFLRDAVNVPAQGEATITNRLFAGAKQVSIIDGYEEKFGIDRFELLIDWGWFYFITKPLFYGIDYFFHLTGNFGVAILLVTVILKLIFFPLASKSYKSMAGMKKVQPEMAKIRERHADDKMKQQQLLMELYKKEKINPLSGCLPILLQIPVFFALYKVLFVTIEMRHAPFFGWIRDLSAPDPTTIFNLFGLIPWDPPSFLMLGVWPLLMGITMFIQMRLNPPPPDPTQAMIFAWMPLIFMFMLASFPAGLVIYWTWNNFLSILQQYTIMKRQGVDVNIWENTRALFRRTKAEDAK
ncbi:membrane protein insertase YidC [Tepidamorphus sp. 3E244]|uniref:membrane protein insertase YidC n=1 Tax=Tepidamorphus sp. 3E244 TaxID=3385498 RepID=UPI0038FC3628